MAQPITWRNVGSAVRSDPLASYQRSASAFKGSLDDITQGIQGLADDAAAQRGRDLESLFRNRLTGLDSIDQNSAVLRDENALRELAGGRFTGFDGDTFLKTRIEEVEAPLLRQSSILEARAKAPGATEQDVKAFEDFVANNRLLRNAGALNNSALAARDGYQDQIDNRTIQGYLDSFARTATNPENSGLSDRQILDSARTEIINSGMEPEEIERALANLDTGYKRFNTLTDEEKAAYNSSLAFMEREEQIALQDIDSQIAALTPPPTAEQNQAQYLNMIEQFDNPSEESTIGKLATILGEDDARDFRRKFQRAVLDNPQVDPRLILSELYLGSEAYAEDNEGVWDMIADDNETIDQKTLDAAMRELVAGVDSQAQQFHARYSALKSKRNGVTRVFGDMRDTHSTDFKRKIRQKGTTGADIRKSTAEALDKRLKEESSKVSNDQKSYIDGIYGKGTFDRWNKESQEETVVDETTNNQTLPNQQAGSNITETAIANLYNFISPGMGVNGVIQAVGNQQLDNLKNLGDFITQGVSENTLQNPAETAEESFRKSVEAARNSGGRSLNEVADSNMVTQGFIDSQNNITDKGREANYPSFTPTNNQAETYMTQLKNGSVNLGERTVSSEIQKTVYDVLKGGKKATQEFVEKELPKLPKATQDIVGQLLGQYIKLQNKSTQ